MIINYTGSKIVVLLTLWFVFAFPSVKAATNPSPTSALDPRIGDVDPILPSDKLERALNGTFHFPPSPAVPWTYDDRGFAKDRLFHVPAIGVHPRILFAPEDLPRIRQSLASSELIPILRDGLLKGIGTKGTWEEQCFSALAAGNLESFKTAYHESPEDNHPPGSGFKSGFPGRNPATKWGVRNPLLASLEVKALLALIDNDPESGKQVAAALDTYERFISPQVDAANLAPRHEFHWSSTRDLVPNEIAYGYDWAWPWMTPTQRENLQSLIVKATIGKYTLGMDLPSHWRNWNHLGLTESYAACLFAIEGEKGDDPRGRDRLFEIYRDYLTYGVDNLGTGTEGIGYHTAGMGHLSSPLVAFANRGKNLLTHSHWRLQTESWLVQTMQPFGGAWQSCSDLANFPPNLSLLVVQKYFYPHSAGIDFVLRNQPQITTQNWSKIASSACEIQWLLPHDINAQDSREKAQQNAAAVVGGGLTYYDKERGMLYTRTGWGENDLSLHVDCRVDTTFATHDHADRGQFTLAALGRAWACDGYRDTESKYHNLVTIDGRGQGYFATPGKWVSFQESPAEVTAVTNAKYCWDWQWSKSSFTESKDSLEQRGQGVFAEAAQRLQSRYPINQWEVDPSPVVTAYYKGFADRAHGDPRMWDDEDGWQLRCAWYPVQKAFRTVKLIRGPHPYVLVMDDLRKDDAEHLYEWRMNAGPDVMAVSITGSDILLGDETTHREPVKLDYAFQGKTGLVPANGDRLLLIRTLESNLPDLPTVQPIPQVATIEYKKTDDTHQFSGRSNGMGTQVVIGSRSVEPKFIILLYPHRQGEELPTTTWNAEHTRLSVGWKEHVENFDLSVTPEGCRILKLVGK